MSAINQGDDKQVFHSNEPIQTVSSFDALGLKDDLLRGIIAYNFEKPFTFQQKAILPIIQGRNVIAQAQPGTGKTAACLIAILQSIDLSTSETQALVLSPTPESAQQIRQVLLTLGNYMNARCHACVAGEDICELELGQHVVSGTPGSVYHHIRSDSLDTSHVRMIVLDQADALLDIGYNDINDIYRSLPLSTQVIFLTATLTSDIFIMAKTLTSYPIRISVKREAKVQDIQQFYIDVEEDRKFDMLCDLYNNTLSTRITHTMIFCNTLSKAYWLAQELQLSRSTLAVYSIHGQMSRGERDTTIAEFAAGSSCALITTEAWAPAIDVSQVSLVINYDLPLVIGNYIHCIGRLRTFERKGVAINFVTVEDDRRLKNIEKLYDTRIEAMPVDTTEFL